jgi:hypothetical protein
MIKLSTIHCSRRVYCHGHFVQVDARLHLPAPSCIVRCWRTGLSLQRIRMLALKTICMLTSRCLTDLSLEVGNATVFQ